MIQIFKLRPPLQDKGYALLLILLTFMLLGLYIYVCVSPFHCKPHVGLFFFKFS